MIIRASAIRHSRCPARIGRIHTDTTARVVSRHTVDRNQGFLTLLRARVCFTRRAQIPLTTSTMARKKSDSRAKRSGPQREGATANEPSVAALSWLLLVYRVPSEPSRNRVSVWRELKRQGALFLQQCVCIFPDRTECRKGVDTVIEKIAATGGTHFLFPLAPLPAGEAERLATAFHELSTKEYEEIMEECDTKFVREIAYERERENYTYEEAEEIREDFEKIQRWFRRVVDRDWFHAERREQVAEQIAHCEQLLEAFEEEVYRRAGSDPAVHGDHGKTD